MSLRILLFIVGSSLKWLVMSKFALGAGVVLILGVKIILIYYFWYGLEANYELFKDSQDWAQRHKQNSLF